LPDTAPPKIPESVRADFTFRIPARVGAAYADLTYAEWEKYHHELGQELAKRIRRTE